uniref:Uncharacterized protein n=1 Tax=Arundo donax TaxID=35708 RepID=A0A0A9HCK3_ARUDO
MSIFSSELGEARTKLTVFISKY